MLILSNRWSGDSILWDELHTATWFGSRKTHAAESSPFDIGIVPSFRVDRNAGDCAVSADKSTSKFFDLVVLPKSESKLRGSDVTGRVEFETEDL